MVRINLAVLPDNNLSQNGSFLWYLNAKLGKKNLSINPFNRTGKVDHQLGYTNTRWSTCKMSCCMFCKSGSYTETKL
jgi:hypothetical protein